MDASKEDAVAAFDPDQTTTWALAPHEEHLAQKWDLAGHADLLRANGLNKEAMLNLGESTLMLALQELQAIPLKDRCLILRGRKALQDDIAKHAVGDDEQVQLVSGSSLTWQEYMYWPKALVTCLFTVLGPSLGIGMLSWYDYDVYYNATGGPPAQEELEFIPQLYRVMLPGLLLMVAMAGFSTKLSMFFVHDLVENKTEGVVLKEVLEANLTNSGVVSALLLTVVFAALMASCPTPAFPWSLLNQWYMAFLLLSLMYSINATIMSSICYLYMQPLQGDNLNEFMSIMALYYGEPVTGMTYCLWLILNATVVWVWGQYGAPSGLGAVITLSFLAVRFLVCVQNLSGWESLATKEARANGTLRDTKDKIVSRDALNNQIKKRNSKDSGSAKAKTAWQVQVAPESN